MSEQGQTFEQELYEVEMSIKAAKSQISTHSALKRLSDNKDFKEIILDGYLEKEASRAVGVLAEPALRIQGDVQVQMVQDIITGIGALRQYFIKIETMGNMSGNAMGEYQLTQAEILQEQDEANTAELIQ